VSSSGLAPAKKTAGKFQSKLFLNVCLQPAKKMAGKHKTDPAKSAGQVYKNKVV
jgi:hypothetical protein